MDSQTDFDVLVVGAGPGGCACALSLKDSGLSVCVVDKATFPRDKTCGDALSPDVVNQLRMLDGNLAEEFVRLIPGKKEEVVGVRVVSPNGRVAELDMLSGRTDISGWVSKRVDFDNFLFQQTKKLPNVTFKLNTKVNRIEMHDDFVEIQGGDSTITGKVIIGADGAHSIVSKSLQGNKIDRNHYCGAVRAYYRNVTGFHQDGMIELHFYKRLLPGYFWIFPLPDNQANVGLGMLSSYISKHSVNLKELFSEVIESEPALQARFKNAELLGDVMGFGLPLGSKKRELSGRRYLLIGDAASLIDPITGEGIGNAIRSGRYAADFIRKAFAAKDFSAEFFNEYDNYLYSKVWGEMRFSRTLQMAFRYPAAINFLTGLVSRSQRFNRFLNQAISDPGFWGDGLNPGRWLKHWRKAK